MFLLSILELSVVVLTDVVCIENRSRRIKNRTPYQIVRINRVCISEVYCMFPATLPRMSQVAKLRSWGDSQM